MEPRGRLRVSMPRFRPCVRVQFCLLRREPRREPRRALRHSSHLLPLLT